MSLGNNFRQYGTLSKFFHWSIFLLFSANYWLIYTRELLEKNAPSRSTYMLLHKSFGIVVFLLALAFVIWRQLTITVPLPKNMSTLERFAARTTHLLLILSMFAMPISGYLMSTAGGYPTKFFGWYELPRLFEKNEALGKLFSEFHLVTSYVVIGLVAFHVFAAFYHQICRHDFVLSRMLPWGKVG